MPNISFFLHIANPWTICGQKDTIYRHAHTNTSEDGKIEYWWLSLLIFLIFAIETVFVILMRNHRKASLIIAFVLATILLIYKSQEFIRANISNNGSYPVEFSHISYFIVGVTVVTGCKKMRAFASYCGMLSGAAFMIAGLLSSKSMVHDASSTFSLVVSITQHNVLWLCGFLLFLNVGHFNIKEIYIPIIGIACMVGFSYLVHYHIIYPDFKKWDDMVIIKIAEGEILGYIIDPSKLTLGLRIFTVAGIAFLVGLTLVLFYWGNDKIYRARVKKYEQIGKKMDTTEIGIFPAIAYLCKKAGWIKKKDLPRTEECGCEVNSAVDNAEEVQTEEKDQPVNEQPGSTDNSAE